MAKHCAADRRSGKDRVSGVTLLFPLVVILYFEAVYAWFAQTGMNVYKVLFALAAGALALMLSRLTPLRALNFILQSVWVLGCGGWIAVQFLYIRATGEPLSMFTDTLPAAFSKAASAAAQNLPFLGCMLLPLLVQFTVQRGSLLHRSSLAGWLLGADWLEPIGAALLAVVLAFVSMTLAFCDTKGDPTPRQQLENGWSPAASIETFGVLPEAVLDLKYNVLHLKTETVVQNYVVYADGTSSALPAE